MAEPPVLVWLRNDLRLADNPALAAAASSGAGVLLVFIYESGGGDGHASGRPPGTASRWWLHQNLRALQTELSKAGPPLVLRRGAAVATLLTLVRETGAPIVYWNRHTEPEGRACDRRVEEALRGCGVTASIHSENLLFAPGTIVNGSGAYIRHWLPHLARLPERWIHKPWQAPPLASDSVQSTPCRSLRTNTRAPVRLPHSACKERP